MELKFKETNNMHSLTRKAHITRDSYKALKKMAIDFDIDDDGKITPETLGECINHLLLENTHLKELKLSDN